MADGPSGMSPRERVLCALSGGEPDVVPFVEQYVAGHIPRKLLGLPPDSPHEPGALSEAMDNDVVKFSHLPPMFYEKVEMDGKTGIGPGMIRSREDLPKVVMPDDETWIDDAREFLKTQVGDRASAGGARLGLSGTLVSMGLDNFSMALYDDPELIHEILGRYVRFAQRTIRVFQELGFDLIWCFDDFAYRTGPMFSPKVFREIVVPHLREATELIKIPWIFHSDGNLFPVMDDLLGLGMSGLHPIEPEAMDLAEAKRSLQGRCCVIGNISVDLLARGTPADIRAAVERCFEVGAPGGGYMLSTGNCIPAYAKIENVRELIRAAKDMRYRARR